MRGKGNYDPLLMELLHSLYEIRLIALISEESKGIHTHNCRMHTHQVLHVRLGTVAPCNAHSDMSGILMAEEDRIGIRFVFQSLKK